MTRKSSSLTLIEVAAACEPVARLRGFLLWSRLAEFYQVFDVVRISIAVLIQFVGPRYP